MSLSPEVLTKKNLIGKICPMSIRKCVMRFAHCDPPSDLLASPLRESKTGGDSCKGPRLNRAWRYRYYQRLSTRRAAADGFQGRCPFAERA